MFLTVLASIIAALSGDNSYYSPTAELFTVLQALTRVVGLTIYSTVPTSEFDAFSTMGNNLWSKMAFSLTLGLLAVLGPLAYISVSNSPISYVFFGFIPCGIYMLFNFRASVDYTLMIYQFYFQLIYVSVSMTAIDFYNALNGGVFYYYINGTNYLICTLINIWIFCRNFYYREKAARLEKDLSAKEIPRSSSKELQQLDRFRTDGWGATEINRCLYMLCLFTGVDFIVNGFGERYYGFPASDYYIWFVAALADIGPLVAIAILTPEKAFTLLARWYEKRLGRLYEDGAFMSALVQCVDTHDRKTNTVWRLRQKEMVMADVPGSGPDVVNRNFWIRGEVEVGNDGLPIVVDVAGKQMVKVKAGFLVDQDFSWSSKYKGSQLDISVALASDKTVEIDDRAFRMWIQNNFGEISNNFVDFENRSVSWLSDIDTQFQETGENLRVKVHKKQAELLKYAVSHLREYQWPGRDAFDRSLLEKSPREIGDNAEKKRVYGLSVPAVEAANTDAMFPRKIDYFISHSWADHCDWKIEALSTFAEEFKQKHHRYPTFWFDKTCIDQTEANDGIAVLPINIGACKKVLVLMGKTYMTRLWCLWELFTLFTFCNRELALERIEIRSPPGVDWRKQISPLHIDDAHCFDPNEEFKLRHLMFDVIKTDVLEESLRILAEKRHHDHDHTVHHCGSCSWTTTSCYCCYDHHQTPSSGVTTSKHNAITKTDPC